MITKFTRNRNLQFTVLIQLDYTVGRLDLKGNNKLVSNMMMDYWGSFARDGSPSSTQFATWPAYKDVSLNNVFCKKLMHKEKGDISGDTLEY